MLGSWARISHRVLDESCGQSPLIVIQHDEAAVAQQLGVIESALVVAGAEKGCGQIKRRRRRRPSAHPLRHHPCVPGRRMVGWGRSVVELSRVAAVVGAIIHGTQLRLAD